LDPKADGYLTISQIQVFDINGYNVALQMPVKATSWGGSSVDQKYGKQTLVGNFYSFSSSKSNVPSCIVDGTSSPRSSLENVFETSVQNTAANDTQFIEIDLGQQTIISSIVYIGRGDAQTRSIQNIDGSIDNLTQVDRTKGIRVEIRDENNVLVFGLTNNTFLTTETQQTMTLTSDLYIINAGGGSAGVQTVAVPDIESYKAVLKPFISTFNSKGYIEGNILNLVNAVRSDYPPSVRIDISDNIFIPALFDSPVTFYHDFYIKAGCPISSCAAITNPILLEKCNKQSRYCNLVITPPYPPLTANNRNVQIFGSASSVAIQEMNSSIDYCKTLYLGNPASIENYIRLNFSLTDMSLIKAYLRGTAPAPSGSSPPPPHFCLPDIAQIFRNGDFVTSFIAQNQSTNMTHCTVELTGTILGLIPFVSRNMIVSWVYNRTLRYKRFINSLSSSLSSAQADEKNAYDQWQKAIANVQTAGDPKNFNSTEIAISASTAGIGMAAISIAKTVMAALARDNAKASYDSAKSIVDTIRSYISTPGAVTKIPETATELQIPSYINIYSSSILDTIAQQFYELLGGQYNISYIYDVLPLGTTMLDIRFDLNIHNSASASYGPINDLKLQYSRIRSATTQTKDVLDQAAIDYQTALGNLENAAVEGVVNPFKGAVARLFYTNVNKVVTITGIIFDDKAVTSFIPELNGGIPVGLGPTPGNINYKPNVVFTKNQTESLDCTKFDTLRRIFDDYILLVNDPKNKYPLLTASPPLDVTKGTLYVNSVLGATQITPRSCSLTWTETLYDSNTNAPISGGSTASITRNATFTYTADTSSWYSHELNINMNGITFLPSSTGITVITPVTFVKPLPKKNTLDNMSNICPVASCEDSDILFSLVNEYNSDPSLAGTILSVTHAFTPNPNQCDVKVSINYDSKIQNIIGKDVIDPVTGVTTTKYDTVKKGAVTYDSSSGAIVQGSKAMPYSGVMKDITIALYVALDKVTCSYTLLDASGQNTGTSIQSNTPALYTPMIYANELIKQTTAGLNSSVNTLQRDYTAAVGSSSKTLTSYRTQTYNAFNSIKSAQPSVSIPTEADFAAIKSEIDSSLSSISAFTDYAPSRRVESEAIGVRGFGLDGIRNYDANIKDTQFDLPLKQREPEHDPRYDPPSYRFLRFTVIATRGSSTVNVGKFTFFYENQALFIKGSVTNPMGTWEGTMADVTGPGPRPGWSDAHKKPLVFAFRDPIAVDAYSFTTALSDAGIEGDPVSWKLEGSSNGTFWTTVDTQNNYPTPLRRFTDVEIFPLTNK
jgi:hypothetical protein